MSVQDAAVSLLQKVWFSVGIDWAAETHAVCVMDANGRIRAQFMIGHTATGFAELLRRPARLSGAVVVGLDPAVAHPDLETGGQDVGQHDRGLVGHPVGQLVQGVLGAGHPHLIGLGAVDEVALDPADARGALVVQAVHGQLLVAVGTNAAGDDHPVPHGQPAHRPADLGDRPDTFVPEDPAVGHRGDVALEN